MKTTTTGAIVAKSKNAIALGGQLVCSWTTPRYSPDVSPLNS
jgi:hypothetical protein